MAVRAAVRAAAPAPSPPNPPATIAGMERFMAVAMRLVRIVPDAPTIIPATIIAVLPNARPAAAAESPVNAFSREITTGMSAPPIGQHDHHAERRGEDEEPDHPRLRTADRRRRRAGRGPGQQQQVHRLLRAAQPQRAAGQDLLELAERHERAPERHRADDRAEQEAITTYSGSPANASVVRNSDQAIRATAPPPTPLNSATICGIAVIRTRRADGTPSAAPTTSPSEDQQPVVAHVSSVASTATSMPSAAILLPRTAVRGPVSPDRPRMNSANATM